MIGCTIQNQSLLSVIGECSKRKKYKIKFMNNHCQAPEKRPPVFSLDLNTGFEQRHSSVVFCDTGWYGVISRVPLN